jgi:uncharacterized protein YbbC (DUF1343 family)
MLDALKAKGIEGIKFEVWETTPESGVFAGRHCSGIVCNITDPEQFRPVAFGIRLIESLVEIHGSTIEARLYPTVANPTGSNHLDRLTGVSHAFEAIMNGTLLPQTQIALLWESMVAQDLIYSIC